MDAYDERDERRDDPDPYTTHPSPVRVMTFVFCMALLVAGFYVMAVSFDSESPWVFTGGLLLAGAAFAVPMREGRA